MVAVIKTQPISFHHKIIFLLNTTCIEKYTFPQRKCQSTRIAQTVSKLIFLMRMVPI